MKSQLIIFLFFLFVNTSFAQEQSSFPTDFLQEEQLKIENVLDKYSQFDFSDIWMQTKNNSVYGVIGAEHQRIRMKLISIIRNPNKADEYLVYGKSNVKNNICEFMGTISFLEVREHKVWHYGTDSAYADKGIKSQAVLVANYEFFEDKKQYHSGVFKGQVFVKFYIDASDEVKYDNISFYSDGYMNNAFVGTWMNYSNKEEKLCNWGDYRVPNAATGFDIGAGMFSPSEKYYKLGWENIENEPNTLWWK